MSVEEVESIVEELRRRGMRSTPQRRAIVAEVLASQGHVNPTELIARVKSRIDGVNPSTIYRTLALLDELGVLQHSHLERGVEYHRAESAGHIHLTCARCGRTDSLPASAVKATVKRLEETSGYAIDLTHFAISGICSDCRQELDQRSSAGSNA